MFQDWLRLNICFNGTVARNILLEIVTELLVHGMKNQQQCTNVNQFKNQDFNMLSIAFRTLVKKSVQPKFDFFITSQDCQPTESISIRM